MTYKYAPDTLVTIHISLVNNCKISSVAECHFGRLSFVVDRNKLSSSSVIFIVRGRSTTGLCSLGRVQLQFHP